MAGAAKAAGKPSRAAPAPDLVGEGKSTTGQPLAGGEPDTPASSPASKPADKPEGGKPAPAAASGPVWPAGAAERVDAGAGFVLGALAWAWIGLPFLKGGPGAVRDTLRAKFLNKAKDGSWLP